MLRNITFILAFLIPVIGLAQGPGFCGTERYELDLITKKLLQNKKTYAEQPQLRSITKYVPVTFHLVADDNGNGRATEEALLAQLCSLNEQYADQDMIFYLDGFNYKDLTVLYNTPTHPTSQFQMTQIMRDPNSANVFVLNSANNGGNTPGETLGYYSRSNDHIVIKKSEANGFSGTLAHEFGHFFSLLHPHNGWGCEPYDEEIHGNPINSAWAPCVSSTTGGAIQAERQDGSNCDNSGDYLCDTPPDYNFGFGWEVGGNQCAPYNVGTMDFNGDVVDPMEENVMAYFIGCDEYAFTNNQKSMIQTDFFSPQRNYIRTGKEPNAAPVDEAPVLIEPINNAITPIFDLVLLDWEDVPNADHYMVIIDRLPSFTFQPQRYLIDESQLYIETLEAERTYYWKVWPFNETRTCAGWSVAENFITGNASAVVDIPFVTQFEVYPNPTQSDRAVNLVVRSENDFRGNVSLYNVYGAQVRNFGSLMFHQTSSQATVIDIDGLTPGMYVLYIQSDAGTLTEKIFIQ